MEPAVRAGLVVATSARRRDAIRILEATALPGSLLSALEADDLPASDTLGDTRIALERDPDGSIRVTVDGAPLGPDDLDLAAIVAGSRHLARARGDLDVDTVDRIERLIRSTSGTPGSDRLRLLLEDYLVRPANRSVVVDRLGQFADRDRRRDRDVDSLFEG